MDKEIIIDKGISSTSNGFESRILYCFNYHLKGLCNKCKAKEECIKERNILKQYGEQLKDLSGSNIEIHIETVNNYSVKDIMGMRF